MTNNELLARLETRNPIWDSNQNSWAEIEDVLFDHVKENPSKYIERGDEESILDYERRLRFARFKGELSPILHRIVGAVTARPPSRPKSIVSKWSGFIENVDGCSTHIDQFLEDRLFETLGFGASAILIDRPMVNEDGFVTEITSKNFQPAIEVRPVEDDDLVAVPYRISQVVDWSLDRCGEFHWVRLYEQATESEDIDADPEDVEIYREFDRTSWRVFKVKKQVMSSKSFKSAYKKDVELVGQGTHNLGMVPLVIISLQKEKPMSFYSPMRYAYHHDIANFVADADLQYASWLHAHPTMVDFRSNDESTRLTVGPGAVIRRNPEFNEDVKYLDFPKSNSDQLRMNKIESVDGLKRISGIDPLSGTKDPQSAQASGRSRAISFSISEERHLRRAAKSMAQAEQRLFEIAERWTTVDAVPPTVRLMKDRITYPQVFTSAGTEGLIEQWLATRTAIASETYDKEMQTKIVDSALGDISAEKKEQIVEEIENSDVVGMPGFEMAPEAMEEPFDTADFDEATREQEASKEDMEEDAGEEES
jgi:hypothetical protein